MAKKITKEPNIKRYKAKCPICECEFEFDTTDAELVFAQYHKCKSVGWT